MDRIQEEVTRTSLQSDLKAFCHQGLSAFCALLPISDECSSRIEGSRRTLERETWKVSDHCIQFRCL